MLDPAGKRAQRVGLAIPWARLSKLYGQASGQRRAAPNTGGNTRARDLAALLALRCKLSCERCRSPIADDGRRMFIAFGPLFDFGRPARVPPAFAPSCHIFYGARVIDVDDGRPNFLGHKDSSPQWREGGQAETLLDPDRERGGRLAATAGGFDVNTSAARFFGPSIRRRTPAHARPHEKPHHA